MYKSVIYLYSYHHGNTQKICNAIAERINAKIIEINDTNVQKELETYDLVGFGSGIDSGKHYSEMLNFAKELKNVRSKNAFIFSTSGIFTPKKMLKDHCTLKTILESKGFKIIGKFGCKGFNTNSVLKYLGGMNKGHPNNEDIKNAELFGEKLIKG